MHAKWVARDPLVRCVTLAIATIAEEKVSSAVVKKAVPCLQAANATHAIVSTVRVQRVHVHAPKDAHTPREQSATPYIAPIAEERHWCVHARRDAHAQRDQGAS